MLEALKLPSRVFVPKYTSGTCFLADTRVSRLASTSSAINRGIRRSRRADSRKPPVSRKEANDRYGDRQGPTRSLGQRNEHEFRPRTQKFRGSELSRKEKGDGPFSRQRNPPDHVTSNSGRHRGANEKSKYYDRTSNELGSQEEHKRRVTRTKWSTPGKTESFLGQNRVDRRASAQGQFNTSTASRSLLNISSNRLHKHSEPAEQQPVILTQTSRLRSGESWVDEAERYSPPKPKSQAIEGSTLQKEGEQPHRGPPAPISIPYTTPASEFLYGHSVVTAALKASRRKLYKLYLYNEQNAEVRGQDQQVRKLGLAAGVVVNRVGHQWLKLMDKMSKGRPHNVSLIQLAAVILSSVLLTSIRGTFWKRHRCPSSPSPGCQECILLLQPLDLVSIISLQKSNQSMGFSLPFLILRLSLAFLLSFFWMELYVLGSGVPPPPFLAFVLLCEIPLY